MYDTLGNAKGLTLSGGYNLWLVVVANTVAVLASYVAVALAPRITAWPKTTHYWLALGAAAIGASIWSMHLIDMLAFQLPTSLYVAILATVVVMRDTQTLNASHEELDMLDMSVQCRAAESTNVNTATAGRDVAASTGAAPARGQG